MALPIAPDHLREIEATRHLFEVRKPLPDHTASQLIFGFRLLLDLTDEALNHTGQRASVGFGSRSEIAGHFGI